jgi:hypothetical protein
MRRIGRLLRPSHGVLPELLVINSRLLAKARQFGLKAARRLQTRY